MKLSGWNEICVSLSCETRFSVSGSKIVILDLDFTKEVITLHLPRRPSKDPGHFSPCTD